MSEIKGMRPTQRIYDESSELVARWLDVSTIETIRDEATATSRVAWADTLADADTADIAAFRYSFTASAQVDPNAVRNTRAAREDLARRLAEAMPRQPLGVRKDPVKWRRADDLMITDGDAPPGCMVVVNLEKGTVMPVVREGMSGSIARWVGNRMIEAAAILENTERTPHE